MIYAIVEQKSYGKGPNVTVPNYLEGISCAAFSSRKQTQTRIQTTCATAAAETQGPSDKMSGIRKGATEDRA